MRYTKAQKDELDRKLSQMTDKELAALDNQAERLLYQARNTEAHRERQRVYVQRYKRRMALAAKMGITDTEGE
jgi:23S rRNA maturation mini-RNase III